MSLVAYCPAAIRRFRFVHFHTSNHDMDAAAVTLQTSNSVGESGSILKNFDTGGIYSIPISNRMVAVMIYIINGL